MNHHVSCPPPKKTTKVIHHRRQVRSLVDHADPGLSLSELHVRTGFLEEGGGMGGVWSLVDLP